ncbi:MAG TPA: IclR family transcriptional regulator [Enterovirga sp.]|nr:IclR family transcriptional regulator [Enterovirga sp.]
MIPPVFFHKMEFIIPVFRMICGASSAISYVRFPAQLERGRTRMDGKGDQPLDRAFAVLEFVLTRRGPVAASSIADATGLPPATAHRMIAQLEARSLLKRALGSKKVTAGPRLISLGMSAVESVFSSDDVHAVLVRLAAKVDEHCHVGIVSELEVRYTDSARSSRRSGLLFEPGRRAPVYCTSIGKCFLASLSPEELGQVLGDLKLAAHTPTTITSRSALVAQVEKVRSDGWASSNEEFTPGVVGCAVPLRNMKRHFIAGLGVSVPAAHCRHDEIGRFLPDLREAASQIEELLRTRE